MDALLQGFALQFLWGAALTVALAVASIAVGSAIGLLMAVLKLWGGRVPAAVAGLYTTVVRGVPDLLIIFVIFFGGTVSLSRLLDRPVNIDPFTAGVAALGFVFGAYATEIFRGAIQSVARGQLEAGRALGLRPRQVFRFVTLPQAWRLALPPFGNQAIILTKQTSLVSVVGLEEIMRKAQVGAGFTQEPFTYFAIAALLYLVITAAMTWALRAAEARAARGLARA
jgi:His/Glu/Gln/Arg/opine family amino acid ABC transporter permease subunit